MANFEGGGDGDGDGVLRESENVRDAGIVLNVEDEHGGDDGGIEGAVERPPATTLATCVASFQTMVSIPSGNVDLSLLDLLDRCDNYNPHAPSEVLVPFRVSPELASPVLGLVRPQVLAQIEHDISVSPSECPFRVSATYICVHFILELDSPALRTAAVASYLRAWQTNNVFSDVIGARLWRDELYDVYANPFGPRRISEKPPSAYTTPDVSVVNLDVKATRQAGVDAGDHNYVFSMERAACALFGVVTYGVHMTVYEQDNPSDPHPNLETIRLWVPRRSATKQTWPLHLDNSVAGGIPTGLSPYESMVKESYEEASLSEDFTRKYIRPAGCISYFYQTAKGWLQPEVQYLYDLRLPESGKVVLKPLDGEVESFELMSLDKVLRHMRAGEFKPNCAIVVVEFLLRHGLITAEEESNFIEIITRLHGRFGFERW